MSLLRLEQHGEVLRFRMIRTLLGRPRYWTGCYRVDGLLIDCGPPALARRFADALQRRAVLALARATPTD